MAVSITTGSALSPLSTGNQNIAHGLGVAPSIIFFWGTRSPTTPGISTAFRSAFGVGIPGGNQGAISMQATNTSSQNRHRQSSTKCYSAMFNGSLICEASVTAADATNFTLTWTTVSAFSAGFSWVAIAGVDASVFNFNLNGSTGSQDVAHGLGSTPKAFLCFNARPSTTLTGEGSDALFNLGAATPAAQWALSWKSKDATSPTQDDSSFSTSVVHQQVDNAGAIASEAAFVSMDGTNISLNVTTSSAARTICGVALGGDIAAVLGTETQKTSTGTKATTGLGIAPVALMFAGGNMTAAGVAANASAFVGFGTASSQAVHAGASLDAVTDSNHAAGRYSSAAAAVAIGSPTNTTTFMQVDAEAALDSLDADGFTLNWTTADATARLFGYLALADAAGGGGAVIAGLASETDEALGVTARKRRAIGQAAETDSAPALGIAKSRLVGLAGETDAALGLGHAKVGRVGQAVEADAALAVAPAKSRVVGLAEESDSALPVVVVGAAPIIEIGIATETDSALGLSHSRRGHIGQAVETDSAPALAAGKRRAIGTASELATAFAVTAMKRRAIGLAGETDGALAAAASRRLTIGLALESDSALAVSQDTPLPLTGGVVRRAAGLAAVRRAAGGVIRRA